MTCTTCCCGHCSHEPLTGESTRSCSKQDCSNRFKSSHYPRMPSSFCFPCEENRLSGVLQKRPIESSSELFNIEWSGLSLNIADLVQNLDASNSTSKDRTPKLGNEEVFTYVESLKNAYLELEVDKGYEDLSTEELEQIRNSINGSHQKVSKWTTERCKGILFRRVHAFIREKLGNT